MVPHYFKRQVNRKGAKSINSVKTPHTFHEPCLFMQSAVADTFEELKLVEQAVIRHQSVDKINSFLDKHGSNWRNAVGTCENWEFTTFEKIIQVTMIFDGKSADGMIHYSFTAINWTKHNIPMTYDLKLRKTRLLRLLYAGTAIPIFGGIYALLTSNGVDLKILLDLVGAVFAAIFTALVASIGGGSN